MKAYVTIFRLQIQLLHSRHHLIPGAGDALMKDHLLWAQLTPPLTVNVSSSLSIYRLLSLPPFPHSMQSELYWGTEALLLCTGKCGNVLQLLRSGHVCRIVLRRYGGRRRLRVWLVIWTVVKKLGVAWGRGYAECTVSESWYFYPLLPSPPPPQPSPTHVHMQCVLYWMLLMVA